MAAPHPIPSGPITDLLTKHNDGHNNFLTHIDRAPKKLKMIAFGMQLSINTILVSILAWRAYSASSQYALSFLLTGELVWKRDSVPWTFRRFIWKMFVLGLDYLLLQTLWPGVRKFFSTHFIMRLFHGFRDVEVVFRKPTGWSKYKLQGLSQQEYLNAFMQSILVATNRTFLLSNVGYNTRSDFWALDYLTVASAYEAERNNEIGLMTWDVSWWFAENGQWNVMELWRMQHPGVQEATLNAMRAKMAELGKSELYEAFLERAKTVPPVAITDLANEMLTPEGIDFNQLSTEASQIAAAAVQH